MVGGAILWAHGGAKRVLMANVWFGAPGVLIGHYVGGDDFTLIAWVLALLVMNSPQSGQPSTRFQREGRLIQLLHARC